MANDEIQHRLEEAFPLATAVAVMDRGQLLCTGTPYDGAAFHST